jgi:chemotaxis protein histidine kinase CheA/CheY-like chemotaxis protein
MNAAIDTAALAQQASATWRQELEEIAVALTISTADASEKRSGSGEQAVAVGQQESAAALVAGLHTLAKSQELKGLDYLISLLEQPALASMSLDKLGRWTNWSELLTLFAAGALGEEGVPELLATAPVSNAIPESFQQLIVARLVSDAQRIADELVETQELLEEPLEPAMEQLEPAYDEQELLLGEEPELLGDASETEDAFEDVGELTQHEPGASTVLSVAADELQMLSEALVSLSEESTPALMSLGVIDPDSVKQEQVAAWTAVIEPIAERFRQFSVAAQFLEVPPLEAAMLLFADNLETLAHEPRQITEELFGALISLPDCWSEYFQAPGPDSIAIALSGCACPDWPLPFDAQLIAQWTEQLGGITLIHSRQVQTRDLDVSPEDVSLEVPADADRVVFENLLNELPLLSGQFSELMAAISLGEVTPIDEAQRVAHTLKGSANTVGIRGIANLTHQLEDILQLLAAKGEPPRGALRETLELAADCLAEMSEAVAGIGAPPVNALEVYQSTIAWTNRLVAGEFPDDDELQIDLPTPAAKAATPEGAQADASEAPKAEAEASLRVPSLVVDRLLDLAGEASILMARLQNDAGHMNNVHRTMRDGGDRLIGLANELERLVDIRGVAMAGTRRAGFSAGGVSAPLEGEFDTLEMEEYNELHTVARRIAESGDDQKVLEQQVQAGLSELANTLAALEAVQAQLRDTTMQTRMVSVATVTPRLSRAVRQTARMVGKLVDLTIVGESTLVDNELLQGFLDPLMHMLRNAVDHGIESDTVRQAAGKSMNGNISLSFSRFGPNLKVVCQDDGGGLNLEAIKQRGIERGLLNPEQEYTEAEVSRLILSPGFSTREAANQVSGRGIGMDVVHQAVRHLRGTLEIGSKPGKGTVFTLLLPLRLASLPVLVARAKTHTLGLSLRGIEQILSADSLSADASMYTFQDSEIPALRLESVLGLPLQYFKRAGAVEVVLLVRDDLRRLHAVVAPELSQTQQVILKPLSPLLGRVDGIEGAAVLGDGTVAPICDLPELIFLRQQPAGQSAQEVGQIVSRFSSEAAPAVVPICLIVDDSVSVRRSMELFATDLGFQVESASDGLDALGKLQRIVPAVMLVDLEMPRMNGVELTAAVRLDPRLAKIPVIMITSRSTEKHRAMAHSAGVDSFLTKPYTEDELASHIHRLILR